MNVINMEPIDRRGFLRGATVLAAAAMLGVETRSHAETPGAEAPASAAPASTHSTLVLATSSGLLNPSALPTGGLGGAIARITIHGHFVPANTAPSLRVVKAHYAVPIDGRTVDLPMYAWAASPGHGKHSTIRVPVAPGGGVLLSVEVAASSAAEDFYFLSAGNAPGSVKLVPGAYALIAGTPDLTGCRLTQYNGAAALTRTGPAGPAAVDFEYVFMTAAGV